MSSLLSQVPAPHTPHVRVLPGPNPFRNPVAPPTTDRRALWVSSQLALWDEAHATVSPSPAFSDLVASFGDIALGGVIPSFAWLDTFGGFECDDLPIALARQCVSMGLMGSKGVRILSETELARGGLSQLKGAKAVAVLDVTTTSFYGVQEHACERFWLDFLTFCYREGIAVWIVALMTSDGFRKRVSTNVWNRLLALVGGKSGLGVLGPSA